jgi:geranylgeranyl transferase type-1 subunit beta
MRCLTSILPAAYTPAESTLLMLAYFTLTGLDVLDDLPFSHVQAAERETATKAEEELEEQRKKEDLRKGYIDFVYSHYLPNGRGFVGSTSLLVPSVFKVPNLESAKGHNETPQTDIPGLAVTFFALTCLLILGDDFSRIDRRALMSWVSSLQDPVSGGFWDTEPLFSPSLDRRTGAIDLRFCYCAAGIRYLLRGWETDADLDLPHLKAFIETSFTYDGGFSGQEGKESHAGYTYCGIGALSFLNILPIGYENRLYTSKEMASKASKGVEPAKIDTEMLIHWLVSRQVAAGIKEEDDEQIDEDGNVSILSANEIETRRAAALEALQYPHLTKSDPSVQGDSQNTGTDGPEEEKGSDGVLKAAGFQGRINKRPDTCYSFWITAALAILGLIDKHQLIAQELDTNWLCGCTQHGIVGGFGKLEGDRPDVLHSALGLVCVSFATWSKATGAGPSEGEGTAATLESEKELEDGLRRVDPTLCASVRVKKWHNQIVFS